MKKPGPQLFLATGILLSWLVAPRAFGDVTLTTLVSFNGSNGAEPWAAPIQGSDGNFYGTTSAGGTFNGGTLYEMTPEGLLTTLHMFAGGTDGAYPAGGLVQGSDGNFYGTTIYGGTGIPYNPYSGNGVVFKWDAAGTLTILTAFGITNGAAPWAGALIQGQDGILYGTTAQGGVTTVTPYGFGTIFSITTNGSLNSLYAFPSPDAGATPYGGLVQGTDGYFYGTTSSGGPVGPGFTPYGTAFKITTNGALTTLASFVGTNGFNPFGGLLQANDGNFYGTTTAGGETFGDPNSVNGWGFGTIFRLSPNGKLTQLFSFRGTNGAYPYGMLIQGRDGCLYGTTTAGGANTNELFPGSPGYRGYGTIFRITTNGTFTTLFSFDGTNGGQLLSGLTQGSGGNFYGATVRGGANDMGTIFQLHIPQPPTISCPAPTIVECNQPAEVTIGVNDPNGDALTVVWTVNGVAVQTNAVPASTPPVPANVTLIVDLPLGTNSVGVFATDTDALTASCSTTVTVVDSTPPVIVYAAAHPNILWPPNHQMVTVAVNALVTDSCTSTTWKIVSVRSSEPVDALGDGHTAPDWAIMGNHTVKLRAERSGRGGGRIYYLTLQATDAAGNLSQSKVIAVTVPKSKAIHNR